MTKMPTLDETYRAICQFLKTTPKLTQNVSNHIAATHNVHSLPAFHSSEAVSDADKLATYKEIVQAVACRDMTRLKGQVANGQAAGEIKPGELAIPRGTPVDVDDDRIPTVMPKDEPPVEVPSAEVKPRVQLPEPKPAREPEPEVVGETEDQLRAILRKIVGQPDAKLDEEKVRSIAHVCAQKQAAEEVKAAMKTLREEWTEQFDEALKQAAAAVPATLRHEFHIGKVITPIEGTIHRQLPQIVAWLSADVPVWLWGQAGGGKTHLARQAAAALGIPYYCAPIDETVTVGKLVGFRNVSNGEFVPGLLYPGFKSGGLTLLDEIDTNATAIASCNSLLANSHYTFPNGEDVTKHAMNRYLAGANSCGLGAVAGYTARVRMDAATLNRFAIIKLEYDQGMEMQLACGEVSTSKPWACGKPASEELCKAYVTWIQRVRAKVGQSVLISPRASYLGVRALRVGIPVAEVAEALVFALVTSDTKSRILSEAGAVPTN